MPSIACFFSVLVAGLCCLLSPQQLCAQSSFKVILGPVESPAPIWSTQKAVSQSHLLSTSVMSPCFFAAKDTGPIWVSPSGGGGDFMCTSCLCAVAPMSFFPSAPPPPPCLCQHPGDLGFVTAGECPHSHSTLLPLCVCMGPYMDTTSSSTGNKTSFLLVSLSHIL